jgi:hypothetical protein
VLTICNAACCSSSPCSGTCCADFHTAAPPPLQAPCHAARQPFVASRNPTQALALAILQCPLLPPEALIQQSWTRAAAVHDVSKQTFKFPARPAACTGECVRKLRWRKQLHNTYSAICQIHLVETSQATCHPQLGCAVHSTYCGKRWCCDCGLDVMTGRKPE